MKMKPFFLITGESGSGKTTLVKDLISELNKLEEKFTGIYSPARFQKGRKTGIYAVDLSTGIQKLLALHQPGWDAENSKREWKMDPEVLEWGNSVIRNSVPTNVLIIDELGYLEFEKNMGWSSAFKILDESNYANAIVVVRAGLLEKALEKFKNAFVITVEDPKQKTEHTKFLISQILAR
jgi:nucleoside-triphosphatase THEP1